MSERLKVGDALRKARALLEEGYVIPMPHLRDRMRERGFDMSDVINCFEVGKINAQPKWDKDRKRWKYVVDGVDKEDEKLSIVFAFEGDTLILITGFR